MNDQKILIESLSMDLRRVSMGLHRGSLKMAETFKTEALKRSEELEKQDINHYLKKLLLSTKKALAGKSDRVAEDALMYSVLLLNFSQRNFK